MMVPKEPLPALLELLMLLEWRCPWDEWDCDDCWGWLVGLPSLLDESSAEELPPPLLLEAPLLSDADVVAVALPVPDVLRSHPAQTQLPKQAGHWKPAATDCRG